MIKNILTGFATTLSLGLIIIAAVLLLRSLGNDRGDAYQTYSEWFFGHERTVNTTYRIVSPTRVDMYIIPGTLTNTSLSVRLINHSDVYFFYGQRFDMEFFHEERDEWIAINDWRTVAFHSIGYGLAPNSYTDIYIPYSSFFYRSFTSGMFRIIKSVSHHQPHNPEFPFKLEIEEYIFKLEFSL
ncbi:MAG: hypothetical protein FWE42_03435 [Defluviitaleaceae bacterium]|nr:hypothetical protein [Defluviitaleaceae bacterium]